VKSALNPLVQACMLAFVGLAGPGLAQTRQGVEGGAAADQRRWLLQQVRAGQATGRQALVDDALARLQRLAPDDPATLVTTLEVQLDQNRAQQAATTLQRLRAVGKGTPELAAGERLWQVNRGNQQSQLQQARVLATAGRSEQALAIYRRLFNDRPPGLKLGIEYWRLRGSQAEGKRLAAERVAALDRDYPGSVALQQLKSQLLFATQREDEGFQALREMGSNPNVGELAAQSEWDRLADLPASEASVRRLRDFIARHPNAPQTADARKLLQAHSGLINDPSWRAARRAEALLDAGRNAEAEAAYREALRGRPRDSALIGGLGQALLRQNRREDALVQFRNALAQDPRGDDSGKWRSLIASTGYWLLLERADAAVEAKDLEKAGVLYAQANRQQPREVNAIIGLANVAAERGDDAEAERRLLEARRIEPGNDAVVGKLVRLYARTDIARMEAFVASLPASERERYAEDVRQARIERMRTQVEAARNAGDRDEAIRLGEALRAEVPGDPWVAYRLAGDLKAANRADAAAAVIADMVGKTDDVPAARYAQALFLSSIDRVDEALEALGHAPRGQWTEDMQALATRLERQRLMAKLDALREAGREAEAVALLRQQPATIENRLLLADWARERGDDAEAVTAYGEVLSKEPGNVDAALGRLESWIGAGDSASARQVLQSAPPVLSEDDVPRQRRLARIWGELGENELEWVILKQLIARKREADPLLYRDAARARRQAAPEEALDLYALAMQDAGMLAPAQASPRDDRALTFASRELPDDDWLKRSIRSDVEDFYQARNPTLTLMQDTGRRSDGTPGFSRLTRDTRIVHYSQPLAGGYAWARLEQVSMDAGSFRTDASGGFDEDFGSCDLTLATPSGGRFRAPRCYIGVQQRVSSGVGASLGWRNAADTFSFDIGHTPSGYAVGHWLGGITVGGDFAKLDWSLTASRRPMTNSLLSQYGAVDPRSGIRWGGVIADGATFSLGYDRGGRNGFWSNWGWHRITGENVLDNDRLRAMAGWYHKLVQRTDLRLDIGLTAMYWRYSHDLGGYSLGQGGYYSPQRYASISTPVTFMWRNDDWSVRLDASVGYSRARTDDSNRFPLEALIKQAAAGVAAGAGQPLLFDNRLSVVNGDSSSGSSYRVSAAIERRLGDRWVAGVGATLQRSRDFSPNTFQFYLRYTGKPWRGNLPMPVNVIIPYGEFR